MATFQRTVNQSNTATSAQSLMNGRVPAIIENIIDFSQTGNVNAAADIFETISVPAGYAILGTGIEVLAADTAGNSGTLTVKLGSTSQGSAETVAATGFIASAGTFTPVVPAGSQAYLNLVVGTGAINAKVRLYAVLLDVRGKAATPVAVGTLNNPAGQTVTSYVAQASTDKLVS